MNQSEYSSDNLFLILWAKRRIIIIATAASVIISSAISLLMEDQYASTCIIAPVKANTVHYLGFSTAPYNSLASFGMLEDAEKMLEILQSSKIRDSIVKRFNLLERYNIKNQKNQKSQLISAYESNVRVKKTKFNGVEITVYDTKAEIAANMANHIANLYDTIANLIIKDRTRVAYQKTKILRDKIKVEISQLVDSAKVLSLSNNFLATKITDPKNVSSTDIYTLTLYASLVEVIETNNEILRSTEMALIQYESDMTQNIPQKFVIQEAFTNDKKERPVRWVIVALSAVGTLLFSSIILLFYERFKQLKLS